MNKRKNRLIMLIIGIVIIVLIILLIFWTRGHFFSGVEAVSPITGLPQGTDGYPWWNDTIFYEIFVRSYYDSDGDGIGDLNGITSKLDYLNDGDPAAEDDLGVSGIWLMPIQPSPSYHGYDVTDYLTVNPDYGTLDDLINLVSEAHSRGMRVIIDLVLNHTSREHPWFVASMDPESEYRDYYIWSDDKPVYNGPWGQQVWYPGIDGYYYALFWDGMPDLNYLNPEVTEEMKAVISFWLTETGIDGFRLDAARHLIEEGAIQENTGSTHEWFESFRPYIKSIKPDSVAIGEIWDDLLAVSEYIQGDELDLAFQFGLADAFISSTFEGNAGTALGELKLSYKLLPSLQYGIFLTNHDQNRTFTQLDEDIQKAKIAASLLLTAPGVPFIYYGEELGMLGEKPDEDIRRPMQWNTDAYAGFSTSIPWRSPGLLWETNNVSIENDNPASLLNHYRMLIRTRNEHAALRVGDTYAIRSSSSAIYAIIRSSAEESILIILNLSEEHILTNTLSLDESALEEGSYKLFPILGTEDEIVDLVVDDLGGFSQYIPLDEIPAYGTIILQLHLDK